LAVELDVSLTHCAEAEEGPTDIGAAPNIVTMENTKRR